MIRAVLIRFEGVVAQVTSSFVDYFDELVFPAKLDLASVVSGFYGAQRPWESYIDEALTGAGVSADRILEIANRTRTALSRPEAWRLHEDVPLALDWMRQRGIPTTIVSDWPLDTGRILSNAGVRSNAIFLYREGAFSDVVAHETRRLGVSASELLYVAADFASDFQDARSMGCYPIVMDRKDEFDESVPNINHLIEIELHI